MFAPQVLEVRSGVAAAASIALYRLPQDGTPPSFAGFWNFTAGAYDFGIEFDPARHSKPFDRMGASGSDPNFKLQVCQVPREPFDAYRPSVHVHEAAADGAQGELIVGYDNWLARKVLGLDS
jgi:hypothetical protein